MQIRKFGRHLYTIFFLGGGGVGLSFAMQLTLGNFALGIPRRNQPCLLDFFSYHELSRMHDCFPFICCGSCLLFLFRFHRLWFNNQLAGGRNSSKRFFFMLKSISWCFGFTSAFLVNILTYFSGGFFNPALTIALAANRNISPKRAVCIVWAQLTGGKKYWFHSQGNYVDFLVINKFIWGLSIYFKNICVPKV